MNECQERLRRLSIESFGAFVTELAEHAWDDWSWKVAPPSPNGNVELLLTRDDERRLLQATWCHPDEAIDSESVRDLAALRLATGIDAVLLATNGTVSESARRDAAAVDVELLESGSLCRLSRRYDVSVPDPDEGDAVDAAVDRAVAYWPADLQRRARTVVATVDELGAFDHEFTRDEQGSTISFVPAESSVPVVRLRFSESALRVFARTPAGEFDTLARLTAHRDDEPTVSDLEPVLAAGIERALDSV